jgi:hypothetical protein
MSLKSFLIASRFFLAASVVNVAGVSLASSSTCLPCGEREREQGEHDGGGRRSHRPNVDGVVTAHITPTG